MVTMLTKRESRLFPLISWLGGTVRLFYALTTTTLLLSFVPSGSSQVQMKTEEHSCEGYSDWETPACESAWQANISAVFLGLATDVREEDVPIILDGKKENTLRLHVTF